MAEEVGFEIQRVCVSLSIMRGKVVNWRQRIVTDWPNDPQRAHKAKAALAQIEDGLLQLASLGHPLHVEEGYTPPPAPEFPKVMFHLYQGSKVFACQADVEEAGDDWYSTMEDARHAAGVTKQNQRGGIFTRSLPAMLWRTSEEKANDKALEEEGERLALAVKRQFIADQRALHRASSEAAKGNSLNAVATKMMEGKRDG
jgi:hypothetical protein